MYIDLHCHTRYSRDRLTSLDALLQSMDRRGLDMLAITDHNTMAGAFDGPTAFLDSLAMGLIEGRLSSPLVHFYSTYANWRKRAGAHRR